MRRAATAISLAGLFFLDSWVAILYNQNPWYAFAFLGVPDVVAALINTVLLAGCFIVAAWVLSRATRGRALKEFGVVFALGFAILTAAYRIWDLRPLALLDSAPSWLVPVGLVLGIIALLLLYRMRRPLAGASRVILLVLFPVVVMMMAQSVGILITQGDQAHTGAISIFEDSENETGGGRVTRERPHVTRVVWLIFDELDQRAAFCERPAEVSLPSLDRLREEAVYATAAYPPAGSTDASLPAMTTGRMVEDVPSATLYELHLLFEGASSVTRWRDADHVFRMAADRGFRVAAGGYFAPYNHVFETDIHRYLPGWIGERTVPEAMRGQAFDLIPGLDTATLRAIEKHRVLEDATLRAVTNPGLDLVFAHFMIPHAPWIYDSDRGELDYRVTARCDVAGYLDNVRLVDRVLSRIDAQMAEGGKMENTALIVTSDHWWRDADGRYDTIDHRVPFLLRMPGQRTGIPVDIPWNTALGYHLVLDILDGKIRDGVEAAQWIHDHADRIPVPTEYDRK